MRINQRKKKQGLAAIEMLIILPILLLLLGAIFEIGRIFIHYTTLNKALQNGARYAVIDIYGTDRSDLIAEQDEIKNMVVFGDKSGSGDSGLQASVLPGFSASDINIVTSGTFLTISANYAYSPIFTTIPIVGGTYSLNMTASSIMRVIP